MEPTEPNKPAASAEPAEAAATPAPPETTLETETERAAPDARSRSTAGWFQTIAFAGIFAGLLAVARNGVPRPAFYVLLVLFVAVATVWLRGQYRDSLDDDNTPAGPPLQVWLILLALGAVTTIAYFVVNGTKWCSIPDVFGFIGIVVTYFGGGMTIMYLRAGYGDPGSERRPPWFALGFFLFGLLLFFVGMIFIRSRDWVALLGWILAGVGLLLVMPIGVQLASERTIRLLKVRPWLATGFLGAGLGGLVTELGLLFAWRPQQSWLIIGLMVLAALVVGIASATQVSVVAIIILVAFFGLTPRPALTPAPPSTDAKHILVALGDSYMSGEGASVFYKGTDEGGSKGDRCHRSPTAWAAIAGQEAPFDGLEFLACSGATTTEMKFDGGGQFGENNKKGQLDAYNALDSKIKQNVKLVVLSIGGNDAGFSAVGIMCLAPGNCAREQSLYLNNLPKVASDLDTLYGQVDKSFPGIPVLIVPYPDPIDNMGSCGQLALTKSERDFIQTFLTGLNDTVHYEADQHGFYYLQQMPDAMKQAHLQLCDNLNNSQPGINFIGLRSVAGDATVRFSPGSWTHNSLHPNELGHQAMLRAFESWVSDHANPAARQTSAQIAAQYVPNTTTSPPTLPTVDPQDKNPCAVLPTNNPASCGSRSQAWARDQLGWEIDRWGLLLGGVISLSAWAMAVGLFALLRYRHSRRA